MQGGASPARVGAAISGAVAAGDDAALLDLMAEDLTFTLDCKAETEQALMEDLLASLRKEKKNLETDHAWRYASKRSQSSFIS